MIFRQLTFNITTLKIVAILSVVLLVHPLSLAAAEYKGDEQMFSKLFAFHSKLASQGNLESITQLGLMYERGEGVKKDRKKAIELYQIAADKGYQPAIEYLVNINAKKSNSTAPVNTADRLRVPTPKETSINNTVGSGQKQQDLEDKLEKEQKAAEAARAELEKLRQTKLEQERKQKQLQDEIEQARKAQEKTARERDKAEAARRELELAKKKQPPAAQKQQDAALNQSNKIPPENTSTKSKGDKDSSFSSNPCNTPAAKFMSTCN